MSESEKGAGDTSAQRDSPSTFADLRGPCQILLIDDDKNARATIRRLLKKSRLRFDMTETDDVPTDLSSLPEHSYDVILLDYVLPRSNAVRFLERMHDAGIQTPVIVITGFGHEHLDIELLEAGAFAYLPKERLSPDSLLRTIVHARRIHRIEEALRESEQKYRALFEATADGIVIADLETLELLYANPSASRMLGYTVDELLAMSVRDLHPRESLDYALSEFKAQAKGEKTLSVDMPCKRKDSTVMYADINTTRVRIDGRECNVGFFRDTTERKRVEQALRESEEKYRTLVENLNVGVYRNTGGAEGRFLQANLAHAEMLGYDSVEEFMKTPVAQLYQDPTERRLFVEEARAKGFVKNRELRLRKKDGTTIWASCTARVQHDDKGEIKWMDGIIEDITERKQAEEALRESEEKYRVLVESSAQTIFMLDEKGTYVFLNRAAAEHMGQTPAELIGKTLWDVFPKKVADEHMTHVRSAMQTGKGYVDDTPTVIRGEPRFYRMSVQPLKDASGKCVAVMGIGTDITEHRALEEQQRALTAGLRAVVDIADELIGCEDVDVIYRRTVELVREKLGVDRCSIFIQEGGAFHGTYGTNLRGETTNEHTCPLLGWLNWEKELATGGARWLVKEKTLVEWDGKSLAPIKEGWNACTPIAQAENQPNALFFNDAAATNAPFDPTRQEVIAVFCSVLADIIERKRAEEALKASEEKFREMAELLPETVFEMDEKGRLTFVNEAAFNFWGYSREELYGGLTGFDIIVPEEWDRMREGIEARHRGERGGHEYTARRKDGTTFPVIIYAAPIFREGKPAGLRGLVVDINERKRAEKERQQFASRLIEVQEQERKKISAMLHDQLGQLLTLTRLDLGSLRARDSKSRKGVDTALKRLDEALRSIRNMAVSLRPPLLDDLGIEAALETLSEEFAEGSNIAVNFRKSGRVRPVDAPVDTCLYRVLQEALTNVARHAEASSVNVVLSSSDHGIMLEISDNGRGIADMTSCYQKGIGLIGMRERLLRCGGSLDVASKEGEGTRLTALIPLGHSLSTGGGHA